MIKKFIYKLIGVEEKEPNWLLLMHMAEFTNETHIEKLQRERKFYLEYLRERAK
jgi:hypothetical protein